MVTGRPKTAAAGKAREGHVGVGVGPHRSNLKASTARAVVEYELLHNSEFEAVPAVPRSFFSRALGCQSAATFRPPSWSSSPSSVSRPKHGLCC